MWKLLFQSVRGTAHCRTGLPCQDSCLARLRRTGGGPVLILTCADGAGSAANAAVGARRACRSLVEAVFDSLLAGKPLKEVGREDVLHWYTAARQALEGEARQLGTDLRQLACTLLLALVGETGAVFAQVGDGAIIPLTDGDARPVFWPQSGEYANTTNFLTDTGFDRNLAVECRATRVDELALLTDGLQRLVLNMAAGTAHRPFFLPLFATLRATCPGAGLARGLRQYLDSAPINRRTDDDKTLMLATRVAPP